MTVFKAVTGRTLFVTGIFLILSGCVVSASSSRIYTAEGTRGYSVDCSGVKKNWGHCYQKAGNICKTNGYDILEVTGESGTVTEVESSSSNSTATTNTTYNRIMVIECKKIAFKKAEQ